MGIHVGTLKQALFVLEKRLSGQGNNYIMPLWISLKNPIRLKDVGSFHADGIAVQLEKKKLLPKGEGKRIERDIDKDWRMRKTYDPMLRQIMIDAGYDGIVYQNTHEGIGDSYILFSPNQLKSAVGNNGEYSPNNPSILL